MLTLKTAYTRDASRLGRWKKVDVEHLPIKELPTHYSELILIIDIGSPYNTLRSLKLKNLIEEPIWENASPGITVRDWLVSIKERTLPYDKTLFNYSEKYVRYGQLFHCGYSVEPIGHHASPDSGGSNTTKEDLYITKPNVSGTELGKYGLFSVNGFYHLADYDEKGVYLFDGHRTMLKGNDNQVGVLSFKEVGELKQIPITEDMIHSPAPDVALSEGIYIKVPEQYAMEGWTFIFSIGGYLHVGDGSYALSGERTFRLYHNRFNLLDRYMSDRDEMDLSSLAFTEYPDYKNPSLVPVKELLTDKILKAYLTLPQSFIVAVKTPQLFHELEPIETPFPGRGLLPKDQFFNQPLVGRHGRTNEYHPIIEGDTVVLAGSQNILHRYDYRYRTWMSQSAVDNKRLFSHPFSHVSLFMRLLGTER